MMTIDFKELLTSSALAATFEDAFVDSQCRESQNRRRQEFFKVLF